MNLFITVFNCFKFSAVIFSVILLYPVQTLIADTVRDNFSAIGFNNNDGTANWLNDWQEIIETDGASAGDIVIINDVSNYQLRIRGNGGTAQEGLSRGVNLLGSTAATLSLNYRRVDLETADEYVRLEIYDNDTGIWTTLNDFGGAGANDGAYLSYSVNILPYISSNTQIRLRASPSLDYTCFFGGLICTETDTVFFDNIQIDYTIPPPPAHFAISHDTAGDHCFPEVITIEKHLVSHAIDSSYTSASTVTLSTSTNNGNWSKTSTPTDAQGILTPGLLDSGTATYTFVAADNGSIKLNLSNTLVETLNINIVDNTSAEAEVITEDPNLTFSNVSPVTFRDEFSSQSYSNNHGTANWATSWDEINEVDNPAAGDIQISGQLQFRGNSNGTLKEIRRSADLKQLVTATLNLLCKCPPMEEPAGHKVGL